MWINDYNKPQVYKCGLFPLDCGVDTEWLVFAATTPTKIHMLDRYSCYENHITPSLYKPVGLSLVVKTAGGNSGTRTLFHIYTESEQ